MTRDEIRTVIITEITALLEEDGKEVVPLPESVILLETGLDSLGFAILVTRLEETLGYDPFTEMAEPVYPQTLSDFLDVYAGHAPR